MSAPSRRASKVANKGEVLLDLRRLLDAASDLVCQIESLAGESSVIDEDLEEGEALARLRAEIARADAGGAR